MSNWIPYVFTTSVALLIWKFVFGSWWIWWAAHSALPTRWKSS